MRATSLVSILLLLFITSCKETEKDEPLTPNFIIIMADDLGYGDLSCYGNKNIFTPHIDQLAKSGVTFTDFHSNGSVCSPTRAALITGKYQQRTGVKGVITAKNHREVGLSLDEISVAEELKKYNYNTAMFGKWHLGYSKNYNPTLQGFDQFEGFVSGNVDYHAHIDQEGYLDWWKGMKIDNEDGYSTDMITENGVKFIKQNNPNKTGKPFFLYLPHEAPHGPYQRRIDGVLRKVGVAGTKNVNKDSIPGIYKEMIEIMDEGIGKIVETLKATDQLENTMIIFLSDNGASQKGSNGILRGHKSSPFEGGSRVPAIISFPNKIPKGIVNHQTAMTMDLLPTLLDFINKKPTNKIDGISLKNNLLKEENLIERDVFYAFKNFSFIRNGKWKLIKNSNNNKLSLFNLAIDIKESNNLALNEPDLTENLLEKLSLWEEVVNKNVKTISD